MSTLQCSITLDVLRVRMLVRRIISMVRVQDVMQMDEVEDGEILFTESLQVSN